MQGTSGSWSVLP
uniref:Uncharacterized protein n=1 Tax=Arundo donax TaxID=35708 RepID=A0A0A9HLY6_ARUDO